MSNSAPAGGNYSIQESGVFSLANGRLERSVGEAVLLVRSAQSPQQPETHLALCLAMSQHHNDIVDNTYLLLQILHVHAALADSHQHL